MDIFASRRTKTKTHTMRLFYNFKYFWEREKICKRSIFRPKFVLVFVDLNRIARMRKILKSNAAANLSDQSVLVQWPRGRKKWATCMWDSVQLWFVHTYRKTLKKTKRTKNSFILHWIMASAINPEQCMHMHKTHYTIILWKIKVAFAWTKQMQESVWYVQNVNKFTEEEKKPHH